MKSIVVLDRRGPVAGAVTHAARGPGWDVVHISRTTRALDALDDVNAGVIVAAPEELTHAGLRRLAQVHRAHPSVPILLTPNGRPVSLAEAAACGVSDVLPYPATPARIRSKLRRALETEIPVEVVFHEAPPQAPRATAHVVTVTSASGGCGKTFFATNLAAWLARSGEPVLLADLDLQFGECAVSLRLRPSHTVCDLDEPVTDLPGAVVRHETGFDVLCAPPDPVAADGIGPREATAVLEAAMSSYRYIVVDTPPELNEVVMAAFDVSKSLVVMATPDVPSLRNLRTFLSTLERLRVPADDVSVVVNKFEPGSGIDLEQVAKAFPKPFAAVLPYAREVTRSLNAGRPVVGHAPQSEISRRFLAAASELMPSVAFPSAAETQRPGAWAVLRALFRKGDNR